MIQDTEGTEKRAAYRAAHRAMRDAHLPGHAHRVLSELLTCVDEIGVVRVTQIQLAERLGTREARVSVSLRALRDVGVVVKVGNGHYMVCDALLVGAAPVDEAVAA